MCAAIILLLMAYEEMKMKLIYYYYWNTMTMKILANNESNILMKKANDYDSNEILW